MKLKRLSIGTLGLLAVSGFAWSCSSKSEDCNANLNCAPYGGELGFSGASGAASASGSSGTSGTSGGASGKGGSSSSSSGNSGDGGSDSAAGSGGAIGPTCDGSLSPDVDGCVISDEFGLFVSPTGDDANGKGTQAQPFATVTGALAKISKIKHVYVCAADYAEPETLEIPDRVSIYGGFTCDGGTWKYDSALPAHLISARAVGATITDAKVGVVIQDVRLDAANAPVNTVGGSSFGLLISTSQGVVLKRVEIRAGKATAGKDGAVGQPAADGLAPTAAQNGSDACAATATAGIASTESSCGSKGGTGGLGYLVASGDPGLTGVPTMNLLTPFTPNGGAGATQDGVIFPGTNGNPGLPGSPGVNGAAAPAIGTFTASGYLVASGGDGTNGYPGQAGGGGGASKGKASCVGASGGAGGMGGCGGKAGIGGSGGGASVAVLSSNSALTIDGSRLIASAGGAGANGGVASAGGSGMSGGSGGKLDTAAGVGKGGSGGEGGPGGNGGNGAGGTGGPSVALFWSGTKPVQVGTTQLTAGEGGKLGQGGRLGPISETWAPDGKVGASEPIFPKDTL